MTVQQMWGVYLTCSDTQRATESKRDGSLAMERYLAYAYLKRLGFVVIRPGTYGHESAPRKLSASTSQGQVLTRSFATSTQWLLVIWRKFAGTWSHHLRSFVSSMGLYFETITGIWTRRSGLPLVSNNAHLSYDQILQKLQIIPEIRLSQPSRRLQQATTGVESSVERVNENKKTMVDFEVYKPAGTFKKRQPGTPDYQVAVIESIAVLPSLGELGAMMNGQFDLTQEIASSSNLGVPGSGKPKMKTGPRWPQILFAVVNGGQVSFINMFNIKTAP
ncbi:tRNA-splicing endonuclease subunit sen54 [Modicella reniformis]|uniref:tRNA-splicing endonuclease subunit sen54 n=1 Tax=Modicella reniformis TaxID=1440133 RepID=A0A9P6MBM1_9FUNG|nr:tRNA-splicing endonuclease subunit sen54 [Modicella reniformis]